jgi:aminoglycoside phosphotransferase (APT) family kinase protein
MPSGDSPTEPNVHRIRAGVIDDRLVLDAIEGHLGVRPVTLTQLATQAPRLVFEVMLPGGRAVIFKAEQDTRGDDAIVLETWAMERAREAGVPVSRGLALETDGSRFPGRYAVFEKAGGSPLPPVWRARESNEADLTAESVRRALRSAGEALRRIHGIAVGGYGRLDDERYLRAGDVRGRDDSWREVALAPALAALDFMSMRRLMDRARIEQARAILAAHDPILTMCPDPRLLHGDLGAKHIYVDAATDELTAIIDFGDREAGDPAFDVANFVLWEDDERLRWLREG